MAYLTDGYYTDVPAAAAVPAERVRFLQRTYGHLAVAVLAFIGIEAALLQTGLAETLVRSLFGRGSFGMLFLLLGFIGVGYAAQAMARSARSLAVQYAGLALYVVLQAIITLPLLWVASIKFADDNLITKAGLLTLGMFAGLSTAVIVTKQDFSWLRTALVILSWVAVGTVVAGMIFGFTLGLWFSALMIVMACAYIAYSTSMVLHHYPTNMYVAAALELFASVALLFYYVLRFAMQMSSNRN